MYLGMGQLRAGDLTQRIIGAAMRVHSKLGPGFLESIYESALVVELESQGLNIERQVPFVIEYKARPLAGGMRADIIVARTCIVEVKAQARILAIHKAQCLSYLRASGLGVGLVINFGALHLRDGIARIVDWPLPPSII